MKSTLPLILIALLFSSCDTGQTASFSGTDAAGIITETFTAAEEPAGASWTSINPAGKTIGSRIMVPPGYQRTDENKALATYLRELPVKSNGSPVLLHNGSPKANQDVHLAVVDMEIGTRDLQQCADAIMRLRGEYLFKQKQFDNIHFNFTSGDRADYTRYAQGFRPVISGSKVTWQKKAQPDNSYSNFRQYMDLVFTYAGTASLEKELLPVKDLKQVQPGDVFIQGGHPGHAVLVMDVAVNPATGKKIFLLAQSYMPAQETHILKNYTDKNLSPWYSTEADELVYTPEWNFKTTSLKRFSSW